MNNGEHIENGPINQTEWEQLGDIPFAGRAERARNARRQEIMERAFNEVFTPVELVAIEAEAGLPEVSKSVVEYEGKEIPVYTLHGRELCCLLHAIDFKGRGDSGDSWRIGSATASHLQEDPSFWDSGKELLATQERKDERDSVSASLSTTFLDTSRNFSQIAADGIWDYGFSHLPAGSIVDVSLGDGGFSQSDSLRQMEARKIRDDLLSPDNFRRMIGPLFHNEMFLNRYDEDGKPLRPDFILTSSQDGSLIPDTVKKHAAYFDVPIFSIDQQAYRAKERERITGLLEALPLDKPYEEMISDLDAINDSPVSEWGFVVKDDAIGHGERVFILERRTRLPGVSPERQQKLVEIELAKKLDFIRRKLEMETELVKQATEAGEWYFRHNHGVGEISHCDVVQNLVDLNSNPELPETAAEGHTPILNDGYLHRLDIELELGGKMRHYSIHDGKHPCGFRKATDEGVPDYYAEFAGLVDDYLAALEENKKAKTPL